MDLADYIVEYLPSSLRAMGPFDLALWQWVGLAMVLALALIVGRWLMRIAYWTIQHLVGRTETRIDDLLLQRLSGPMRLLGSLACARVMVPALGLPANRDDTAMEIMLVALAIALVWGTLRAIDVLTASLSTAAWARERRTSRALLSLLGRIAKVIVIVFAIIALLGSIGVPVASLIAGLGIGGIAIAFGAQKTVENLFGAFAIGVDQPLREGDFALIDSEVLGTVESVGLRSTRVRTLDRTVISLPNGRLADMKIETFAPRDRCRLSTTIGLEYGTSSAKLCEVMAELERILRAHPKIWPDTVVVRFAGFAASSLDIEVMAWFQTGDWDVFRECRQEVLLGFMRAVEQAGAAFAFPTQTIHLATPRPIGAPPAS